MKKLIHITLVSVLVFLGSLITFSPSITNAGPLSGSKDEVCAGVALQPSGVCDPNVAGGKLRHTVRIVIDVISVIAGIISVIFVIIAGFRFVTSGGEANAVASARSAAVYALIGLVVVAVSQILVKYVMFRVIH